MSNEVVIEESGAVMQLNLPLPRLDKKAGKKTTKIREMYDTSEFVKGTLLMATSDGVSVKDEVLLSGIPGKGEVLNRISSNWFRQTEQVCPNHFITDDFKQLPVKLQEILKPYKSVLAGRFMLVLRAKPIMVEFIPRDYLIGSVRGSYKETGQICGIELPKGLEEGDKFPATIFTSSTKAEIGQHDENISYEEMIKIVGLETAQITRAYTMSVYSYVCNLAFLKGIKAKNTKFEFGYDDKGRIIQIDETFTPDTSIFDPDYSKQPLRDWLASIGWDGTPIELPEEIIAETSQRYIKGCEILTGYKVTV